MCEYEETLLRLKENKIKGELMIFSSLDWPHCTYTRISVVFPFSRFSSDNHAFVS